MTIALAYSIGGFIPLSGYMVTGTPLLGLQYSALITMGCLFVFGYLKSKLIGQHPLKGAFSVMLIGVLASTVAFVVAKLVSH